MKVANHTKKKRKSNDPGFIYGVKCEGDYEITDDQNWERKGDGFRHSSQRSQWRTEEGGFGGSNQTTPPPSEIPKAQQNRAKFNPIEKTVKNS